MRHVGRYVRQHHIGLIALFVALSGTAYAALGKDSVGPKQIRANAVGSEELKAGAAQADEIAAGAVSEAKIAAAAVGGAKIAPGAVTGTKVEDFSLHGADVGEAQFFNFAAVIGVVPANACAGGTVSGLPTDARDHLLLTPIDTVTAPAPSSDNLDYSARWSTSPGQMRITVCNVTGSAIDDGTTNFNLLVINAQ